MLHPFLLHVFINDLDDRVGCSLSKCAGGKNMKRAADTPEDCAALQRDFDKLEKCADITLTEFRERKCKVLNQERTTPSTCMCWNSLSRTAALQKRTLGSWG